MAPKGKTKSKTDTGANLGFEAKLWAAADALRNNMDAAEYKHVVLGLIFLKYISDAFEAKHAELETQRKKGADPEDPDEYKAASIFWVPKEARWSYLKAKAPQPTIGTLVDDAMAAIERDNPSLKGVLPKDFGRVGLDKIRLGQIINLVSDIDMCQPSSRPDGHPSPSGRGARGEGYRDRRGEVLFIDAGKMGTLVDRTHRELTDDDLAKIAGTYHLWRGDPHPASGHPLPGVEGHYRGGFNFSGLVEAARELRNKQTPAETIMWELLRDQRCANLKFRRQHQIGDYIADFFCNDHKLVIELDGKGHRESRQAQKDKTRDAYLKSVGMTVLRIQNEEFLENTEKILQQIANACQPPSPSGRGAGGEGVAVYRDIPGFCRSATLDEIRKHGHVLTPGRYVGAEEVEDDGELFEDKMKRLGACPTLALKHLHVASDSCSSTPT